MGRGRSAYAAALARDASHGGSGLGCRRFRCLRSHADRRRRRLRGVGKVRCRERIPRSRRPCAGDSIPPGVGESPPSASSGPRMTPPTSSMAGCWRSALSAPSLRAFSRRNGPRLLRNGARAGAGRRGGGGRRDGLPGKSAAGDPWRHALFAMLWLASALLFRKAAPGKNLPPAGRRSSALQPSCRSLEHSIWSNASQAESLSLKTLHGSPLRLREHAGRRTINPWTARNADHGRILPREGMRHERTVRLEREAGTVYNPGAGHWPAALRQACHRPVSNGAADAKACASRLEEEQGADEARNRVSGKAEHRDAVEIADHQRFSRPHGDAPKSSVMPQSRSVDWTRS